MTKKIVNTSQTKKLIDRLMYDNPVTRRPRPEEVRVAAIMHRCKCNDWREPMKMNKKTIGIAGLVVILGVLLFNSANNKKSVLVPPTGAPVDSTVVAPAAPVVQDTIATPGKPVL